MPSRILICGGREFDDQELFDRSMDLALPWFDARFCVIHGGARGADRMGSYWAIQHGYPLITMPANWSFYGKQAGSLRNGWMLDFGLPDLVIAFPGGIGTANMVKQSKGRGILVWEPK